MFNFPILRQVCFVVPWVLNLSFTEARILSSLYWLGQQQVNSTLIHPLSVLTVLLFLSNTGFSGMLWVVQFPQTWNLLRNFSLFLFSSHLFSLGNSVFTTTQKRTTYHCHRLSFGSLFFFCEILLWCWRWKITFGHVQSLLLLNLSGAAGNSLIYLAIFTSFILYNRKRVIP